MKLAIFSDAFHPQVNGIVTSIMSIAENMADRGHEVVIVAPSYRRLTEYKYPGVKVIRVPSISASFYDDFRWTNPFNFSIYKKLRNEDIDVVHFMTPVFISLIGIKFARKMGLPIVGTFHTFIANPLYFEHLFKGPVKITEEAGWVYLNYYYDCADYVTAPTSKAVEVIREHSCKPPLEAISNGIDFKQFDNSKSDEFRKKYNLGSRVILYIGRIAYEKNLQTLMDAFDLVYASDSETQLLLIGDGPQKKEFEAYAAGLKSGGNIIFAGLITHNELIRSGVFKAVSLFVTASRTETQGITILEAQANGLPCVVVREGGVVNLVKDGYNGFVAEPEDPADLAEKIQGIFRLSDEEKSLMAENTLAMADAHRMDKIIDRWEEIYKDMIRRKAEFTGRDYLHFRTLIRYTRMFKLDFPYLFSMINPMRLGARVIHRREKKGFRWKKGFPFLEFSSED